MLFNENPSENRKLATEIFIVKIETAILPKCEFGCHKHFSLKTPFGSVGQSGLRNRELNKNAITLNCFQQ